MEFLGEESQCLSGVWRPIFSWCLIDFGCFFMVFGLVFDSFWYFGKIFGWSFSWLSVVFSADAWGAHSSEVPGLLQAA